MGLKVYQLVEELKKYSQELDVVVDGYEGGTDPLEMENIGLRYVDKSAGMGYFGKYGDAEDSEDGMDKPLLVVILGRKNYG